MSKRQTNQQGNMKLVIIGIVVVGIALLWYVMKQSSQSGVKQELVQSEYSVSQQGPGPTRSLTTDLQDLEEVNIDQLDTGLQENATDANAF